MKRIVILIIGIFFSFQSFGQTGLNINISVDNYYNDTLLIAYYYGDRQLVYDTLYKMGDPAEFSWKKDTLVEQGMYLAVTIPERQFVQFVIPPDDQVFDIHLNGVNLADWHISGSVENDLFTDYIAFISEQKENAGIQQNILKSVLTSDAEKEEAQKTLENIDKAVADYIEKIASQHPESITALILNSNKSLNIPEFTGSEQEAQVKRYAYYKRNYFKSIDTHHPAIIRTPILDQRINYYLEKLTPNHPDSIITSIDYLLSLLEPNSESFRYYLSSFINKYANSKVVGMDAVYVHIADNYYDAEKTPWLDEENLLLIKDNANDIRPVLLGKIAPDLVFYTESNEPLKVSDLDYSLLVVLFWAPDCGHCKKTMPEFVEIEQTYRDKNVKVLAVCTKHKEKLKTCWETIPEKGMTNFVNVGDEFHKSRFKIKYNVKTTPKVFILDKDRTILMKNIGADQLPGVLDELLKQIN